MMAMLMAGLLTSSSVQSDDARSAPPLTRGVQFGVERSEWYVCLRFYKPMSLNYP